MSKIREENVFTDSIFNNKFIMKKKTNNTNDDRRYPSNIWTEYTDEKMTCEENKSRMNNKNGVFHHIKTDDKKLQKLVLEQEKLINLLVDYYHRTSICGVKNMSELKSKQNTCLNLEEVMFPLYSPDDYDSPDTPILSFIHRYEGVSDSYDYMDEEEIDLSLIIENNVTKLTTYYGDWYYNEVQESRESIDDIYERRQRDREILKDQV